MAALISATLLLVFIGSSAIKGDECTQENFKLATASFLLCVGDRKVTIEDIDDVDVEEICRTVPAKISQCLNEKLKKPLANCKDEQVLTVLEKLEEAQTGPAKILCYDNGRYLKELKENDGKKCNDDLKTSFEENCQIKKKINVQEDCQAALENLNCLKKSFPDTCKENVKRIIYTLMKQTTMILGCKEYLKEHDKTDLEIKLSSAVMTQTNLGLLITILLALILF